ncbi:hypothetical protein J6590_077081 [Homalodisca vitripennis]|nr:hypothetical protein J6590_077081 [Homalodisca vitripennis]
MIYSKYLQRRKCPLLLSMLLPYPLLLQLLDLNLSMEERRDNSPFSNAGELLGNGGRKTGTATIHHQRPPADDLASPDQGHVHVARPHELRNNKYFVRCLLKSHFAILCR